MKKRNSFPQNITYRALLAIVLSLLSVFMFAKGKRVLFIGDSITDGAWGNSKVWNTPSEERNQTDQNHIYGHGYMMIAAADIQARYPEEGWEFFNRGISGNTLNNLSARWEKDVLALHPDIVSILIGTNDVDKCMSTGINTDEWGAKFRSLLDMVLKENPNARFVLCTPFVAEVGKIANSNYTKREQMIANLACEIERISLEYPCVLVPFRSLLSETLSKHPSVPAAYWIWDGIHPSPAMHSLMAHEWLSRALPFISQ